MTHLFPVFSRRCMRTQRRKKQQSRGSCDGSFSFPGAESVPRQPCRCWRWTCRRCPRPRRRLAWRGRLYRLCPTSLLALPRGSGRIVGVFFVVFFTELSVSLAVSWSRSVFLALAGALDFCVTNVCKKKAKKWFEEHCTCSVPFGTLHPECSSARRNSWGLY